VTRKEILLFQLHECRNEFADALEGLSHDQLDARPIEGRNPIGWIVCHCMKNFDFFLYEPQNGRSLLSLDDPYGPFARYQARPPGPENPPPDMTGLAETADRVFAACIAAIEPLDERAFDEEAPHWMHRDDNIEHVAGNCARVINHSNAHLRQIWMLRGAMGDTEHWPVQTLIKDRTRQDMPFVVPDRAAILARRHKAG
jgi:hypothetical protein